MQVAPLRETARSDKAVYQLRLRSLSAPLLVTTTNPGRQARPVRSLSHHRTGVDGGGGGLLGAEEVAHKKPVSVSSCLLALLALALSFWVPLCYSGRGRWPVIKEEADSSLLPESEGSAQLGTADLLSVCLSLSKSTPLPPYLFSLLPHLSLPPDHCTQLNSGSLY